MTRIHKHEVHHPLTSFLSLSLSLALIPILPLALTLFLSSSLSLSPSLSCAGGVSSTRAALVSQPVTPERGGGSSGGGRGGSGDGRQKFSKVCWLLDLPYTMTTGLTFEKMYCLWVQRE